MESSFERIQCGICESNTEDAKRMIRAVKLDKQREGIEGLC